jgi:Spy/CpxP family protein refolding chaperone
VNKEKEGGNEMKKIGYMIPVLAALLLIGGVALAQPTDDRPGPGAGGGWTGCPYYPGGPGVDLKLTADQEKKLADLKEKFIDSNDKIADDMRVKERALRKLYNAEKPDIRAIDKAEDEIKAIADKRIALSRDFRNKARALLTGEQLAADPYAFMGPGSCPFGGPGIGYGRGMTGGYGPGWGGGTMRGWGGGPRW